MPRRDDGDLAAENRAMRERIAFLEAHVAALSLPRANAVTPPPGATPDWPED